MHVGVGYSELPDTAAAGREAALEAAKRAGRGTPCDLALLFATARHDAGRLREAVASVIGPAVPIVGGGAVGIISNDRFGYAGDQIGLALIWLEGARCELLVEGDLAKGEAAAGERLGRKLLNLGTTPASPVLLLYDSINRTQGAVRMHMATYLLEGLERGLGFLPDLFGAGMMGDYACTTVHQWTGREMALHTALALAFSGEVRVDTAIMHGCRPASSYYTVTKADKQTILEINGQPALRFIGGVTGSALPPEGYPFFLTFGVNKGDKWGEFDEDAYANRLCLAVDKEREGLVMFEPDMVEGTEFQIMYRSVDLDYIAPKLESAINWVVIG